MQKDTYQAVPVLHFAEVIQKYHAKKRLQCLVLGNFGAYNYADEAILAGELVELAKISNLKVTVASQNPTETRRLHGSVRTVPFSQIRKEIKKSDFVVAGGSGLFTSKYLPTLSLLLWKQRIFKKKLYMIGVGLSDSVNIGARLLAYAIMKGATVVTARDHITADLLKRNRIHVHVFKDQSFFMDPAPVSTVMQDPYFKRFYKKSRLNIGLSLRKPKSKKDEKYLLNEITAFIAKNRETADFWFYATDHNPKHFNDEKFGHLLHETIKKKVGKDVQFHFIPTIWNPQTFFASVKLMNLMVTMCPHTALFGYRNNTNIVCVIDKKQASGFMTTLGKDVFKIADLTAKKLQTRLPL